MLNILGLTFCFRPGLTYIGVWKNIESDLSQNVCILYIQPLI